MLPFLIDQHIARGETLPLLSGPHAVYILSYCAGQVALLGKVNNFR